MSAWVNNLIKEIKAIFEQRHILKDMVVKEQKAKYTGSILGLAWAIIIPILIMAVISFVFGIVLKMEIERFPLFVLSAILPWMFFAAALSNATNSILNQKHLLRQFTFNIEILPLSSILADLLNFLLGWIVIIPIFLFFKLKVVYLLPSLCIIVFLHLLFTIGLGIALSILNVFFRDIGQLLGIALMFWFWITPIFYSVDIIPLSYRWIYNFNPITPYIVSYRDILFEANLPHFYTLLKGFLWAIFSLTFGFIITITLKTRLLKRI